MTDVTNVTYDDYLEAVLIGSMQFINWRNGQVAFNTLAQMRPDLAEQVRGSDFDPFYADQLPRGYEKMVSFLAYLREHWDA